MSEVVIFCIGAVIFAITVYGSVMAGGLLLTRQELEEHEELRERVDDNGFEAGLPVNVKY